MNIIIRKATIEDAEDFVKVNTATWLTTYKASPAHLCGAFVCRGSGKYDRPGTPRICDRLLLFPSDRFPDL